MMHNKKSADGIIKKGGTQASKMMAGGGMAKTKMMKAVVCLWEQMADLVGDGKGKMAAGGMAKQRWLLVVA
jgi:hypothetical protein